MKKEVPLFPSTKPNAIFLGNFGGHSFYLEWRDSRYYHPSYRIQRYSNSDCGYVLVTEYNGSWGAGTRLDLREPYKLAFEEAQRYLPLL